MTGKWSNAASPESLIYPGEPAGAMELGDGGAQERWRFGSGTQERRYCSKKVRRSGESTRTV